MARVTRRKAAKDYPDAGINKGDLYYYAKIKTGPRTSRTLRSIKPLRQSQLTSSEFKSEWYSIDEIMADNDTLCAEDVRGAAEDVRALGEETDDRFNNLPDSLQTGPTGELLEARSEACQTAADELEGIADRMDDLEGDLPSMNEGEDDDTPGDDMEDLRSEAWSVLCDNEPE